MGFREEFGDIHTWFKGLSTLTKGLMKAVLLLAWILVGQGLGSMTAPILGALFWTAVSAETRTVPLSLLSLLGLAGMFFILPAAAFLEMPFQLIAAPHSAWPQAMAAGLELLLLTAVLALFSLAPQSRLRFSAGITDYALAGIWLGLGLEAGIGFLQAGKIAFLGQGWGWWPLFPGLLGRLDSGAACASPLTLGLVAGLMVGVQRYLFGPDLGSEQKRIYGGAALAVVVLWVALERAAFVSGAASGLAGVWHWLDLKGRLLGYLAGLSGLAAVVVEWFLLQEQPASRPLQHGLAEVRSLWQNIRHASHSYQLSRFLAFQARRLRTRELALAEEMRPLFSARDREALDQRLAAIRQALQEEEGAAPSKG